MDGGGRSKGGSATDAEEAECCQSAAEKSHDDDCLVNIR